MPTEGQRRWLAPKVAGTKGASHLSAGAGALGGLECDDGELVGEARLELVVAGDDEVALGLDHEEARRHAHLEPLLLRIEPLLRELATELRRLDALTVLLEPQRGIAHLTDGDELDLPNPCGGLVAFQPRAREVRLLDTLSERIGEREPERPRGKIRGEHLSQHGAERGVLGAADRAWEPTRANQP